MQRIVLASRPQGKPTPDNFRLEEAPTPACPKSGLLLRVKILSLDPYMRGRMDDRKSYAKPVAIGEPMTGESVAEVIESDHPDYAVGDTVLAPTGWVTHAASNGLGVGPAHRCASSTRHARRCRRRLACSACRALRPGRG